MINWDLALAAIERQHVEARERAKTARRLSEARREPAGRRLGRFSPARMVHPVR